MPIPPARTGPATSVTTGLGSVSSCRWRSTIAFAPWSIPPVVASLRSAPEQNTRPDERISTTFTSSSSPAVVTCATSSVTSCRDSALRLCGESSVIVATGPSTSRWTSSAALSEGCRSCAPSSRMAYDVELADRLRDQLEGTPTTEKRMFGGLAFLVGGNMAVAASSQGGLMVRCAPRTPTPTWPPARRRSRCAASRWTAGCACRPRP